jgi:hypothetical protein
MQCGYGTGEHKEPAIRFACESSDTRFDFCSIAHAELHFERRCEACRWSIVNLSIIVSNICKALMNVCAMVRSVSL